MFDGILFDLDGTLWDAVPQICASWNLAIAESGAARPPLTVGEIRPCMGLLLPDIGKRLFPTLPPEERDALTGRCCQVENAYLETHCGVLYDGVPEVLTALSERCPLYVVSNCQDGYIEAFFASSGLGRLFQGFECAGRTGRPKSENIELVARREGLKRPVYVGDTVTDLESAQIAGVPFLHAAYGFGNVPAGVPAVKSFRAIPDALERMSPF